MSIEVLIPDFKGDWDAAARHRRRTRDSQPQPGPSPLLPGRPPAGQVRAVGRTAQARKEAGLVTKTGIMVGIGEKDDEVVGSCDVQQRAQTDILTIGQYLQPTRNHLPIDRWVTPEQFDWYREVGMDLGWKVESGPMVRSSLPRGHPGRAGDRQGPRATKPSVA